MPISNERTISQRRMLQRRNISVENPTVVTAGLRSGCDGGAAVALFAAL